jgi:hypothetical protein
LAVPPARLFAGHGRELGLIVMGRVFDGARSGVEATSHSILEAAGLRE